MTILSPLLVDWFILESIQGVKKVVWSRIFIYVNYQQGHLQNTFAAIIITII